MKNVIILGCPRSGTSMTAGLFKHSDLFMGDVVNEPTSNSPGGRYELQAICDINEEIIKQSLDNVKRIDDTYFLVPLREDIQIKADSDCAKQIKTWTDKNFCYKDPRFSYTLPAWKPFLKNCVFIVLFREPSKTILSIQKLAKNYWGFDLSKELCVELWNSYYQRIMNMCDDGDWLFLHYDQLFERETFDKIRSFTGVNILDESHPNKKYMRNNINEIVPECDKLYTELCKLAGYF
jgi:hypothetical protein